MTLSVTVTLPQEDRGLPPLVLVHGAANSSGVWAFWQTQLAQHGWPSYAIDLRGHGGNDPADLSTTTMEDYADDVRRVLDELQRPAVVAGWSMGGLVAIMAAARGGCSACVAFAPSAPANAVDPAIPVRTGEFGPEEYGITSFDPNAQRGMSDLVREERLIALSSLSRESRMARDQRRRGIVIHSLPCPFLLITGTRDREWPLERYDSLNLPGDRITMDGASHWGLVLNRLAIGKAAPQIASWLREHAA